MLWAESCPLKIQMLKPKLSAHQNVIIFGHRAFNEVIKLKDDLRVCPNPI